MRKRVGYFSGSNSDVLTALVCGGSDTIPVSNGRDNHGHHVRLINDENRYDLLIAHVHKIFAAEDRQPDEATFQDVFHLCRTYSIPLLITVPESLQDPARQLLSNPPDIVRFVDPSDTLQVARDILAG